MIRDSRDSLLLSESIQDIPHKFSVGVTQREAPSQEQTTSKNLGRALRNTTCAQHPQSPPKDLRRDDENMSRLVALLASI